MTDLHLPPWHGLSALEAYVQGARDATASFTATRPATDQERKVAQRRRAAEMSRRAELDTNGALARVQPEERSPSEAPDRRPIPSPRLESPARSGREGSPADQTRGRADSLRSGHDQSASRSYAASRTEPFDEPSAGALVVDPASGVHPGAGSILLATTDRPDGAE